MNDVTHSIPAFAMLVGILIMLSILLRKWFARTSIPSLIGFLFVGFLLRLADARWKIIDSKGETIFEFLAGIGIIVILFRVGLESNLHNLIDKLPRAVPIWIGNVLLSGIPGFAVAYYVLEISMVPSLFVAIALTATSIAVSVSVWQEVGALRSPDGDLLVDVAALDDISGVALMALLIALVPILYTGNNSALFPALLETSAIFVGKALLFGTFCLLFAQYAEEHISQFIKSTQAPDPILFVLGTGIVIASIAGFFGFPLAIGALFAGLVFSRDPEVIRLETMFLPLYEFFMPFFFINIGLMIDPAALGAASQIGAVLLIVAIVGKVVGAGVPALLSTGLAGAAAIGVSMVPRAEIALVVMQEGAKMGTEAMPDTVFAAIVLVSAVTCIVAPFVTAKLLKYKSYK
ncbi:MAG: cation:proton antiporter [Rhodospirillales bacterium]|jgi:Kef-type K+ transport system membrane component KefB